MQYFKEAQRLGYAAAERWLRRFGSKRNQHSRESPALARFSARGKAFDMPRPPLRTLVVASGVCHSTSTFFLKFSPLFLSVMLNSSNGTISAEPSLFAALFSVIVIRSAMEARILGLLL
jgi:hypothetical protein